MGSVVQVPLPPPPWPASDAQTFWASLPRMETSISAPWIGLSVWRILHQPTDTFIPLPYAGHNNNTGGSNPTSPPLIWVKHVCALEGTQWAAPLHGDVCKLLGEEMQTSGSGRDMSRDGSSSVTGIQTLPIHSSTIQIPVDSDNGSIWWLGKRKSQKQWAQMLRILGRKGTNAQIYGLFYEAIFQAILLYWPETWVLMSQMVHILRSLHHRVAC